MELAANRRPIIYFPLRHHFEQNLRVRHPPRAVRRPPPHGLLSVDTSVVAGGAIAGTTGADRENLIITPKIGRSML